MQVVLKSVMLNAQFATPPSLLMMRLYTRTQHVQLFWYSGPTMYKPFYNHGVYFIFRLFDEL